MHPNQQKLNAFKKTIWTYYKKHGRSFDWRKPNLSDYEIAVSEIMLQQTQADRVAKKYPTFIKKFPHWQSLAKASKESVLKEWLGLGYNRRALNLKNLAQTVVSKHKGSLPKNYTALIELPSIGKNTAGSILAFAFNIPHPFIETNIRSVFIHFFFKNHTEQISDKELLPLIEKTLDQKNPREWFYALMDYGVMLKKLYKNPSQKSTHHRAQSPFKGSRRELRAAVVRYLINQPETTGDLHAKAQKDFKQYSAKLYTEILEELTVEGFIKKRKDTYIISR